MSASLTAEGLQRLRWCSLHRCLKRETPVHATPAVRCLPRACPRVALWPDEFRNAWSSDAWSSAQTESTQQSRHVMRSVALGVRPCCSCLEAFGREECTATAAATCDCTSQASLCFKASQTSSTHVSQRRSGGAGGTSISNASIEELPSDPRVPLADMISPVLSTLMAGRENSPEKVWGGIHGRRQR